MRAEIPRAPVSVGKSSASTSTPASTTIQVAKDKPTQKLTHGGDGDLRRLDGDETEEVDEHVQVVRREAQHARLLH